MNVIPMELKTVTDIRAFSLTMAVRCCVDVPQAPETARTYRTQPTTDEVVGFAKAFEKYITEGK